MLKEEYATKVRAHFAGTTYGRWLRDEGVAVFEDWAVPDVWELETKPWPRLGGRACFITLYPQMEGQRGMYVVDIEPGGKLEPIRHLYEQMIMILEGRGATEVWQEGDTRKHVFEWGKGSIFSPPLNTWYRMYNLGAEPVKFVAYNRAPMVFNEYRNVDFVFNCPFAFRDRFNGEDSYFTVAPRTGGGQHEIWETNFVADGFATDLDPAEYKVSAGHITAFCMAKNAMNAHISQWPVGRYHKAHYHGAGAMLLGLRSQGYILLWPSRAGNQPYSNGHADDVIEVPWGRGSIYSPPNEWFHQHFNTGKEPARHLAIRGGNLFTLSMLGGDDGTHANMISASEGGSLLEYEEEDPEVRRRYRAALVANGVENQMPDALYEPGYARSRQG
jgi:mannose-6-phosphate isomerase-like protein (cupin superfamily)